MCNILLMKQFLPLLILTGLLSGQDAVETPSIDTLSQFGTLEELEEQARMDAKADFTTLKKLQWGFAAIAVPFGISALISEEEEFNIPLPAWLIIPVASRVVPVKLPKSRKTELTARNDEYRKIYLGAYEKAAKKERVSISSKGCCVGIGVATVAVIILVWAFSVAFSTG